MAALKKAGTNVDGERASSTGGSGARTLKKAGANVDGERFCDREAEPAVQPRPEQRAWSRIKSWLANVLRKVDTVEVSIPGLSVTLKLKQDTTEE